MRKRDILIFLAVLTLTALVSVSLLPEKTIETGSWGLHFDKEGFAPSGSASPEALLPYQAAFLGNPGEKRLYLTFDSGYENGCTAKILDVLRDHQVPAAFFLVGNYLDRNPELVRRMVAEGHIVGNHTMHHWDMSKLKDFDTFSRELTDLEAKFQEITGQPMEKYYRPPQGIFSIENLEMAKKLGYRTVFWSLAYVDWNNDAQPSREQAMSKLLPRTHNGAVVLLHSTSRTNAEILDELLTKWEDQGYTFGKISELFSGDTSISS